jgi:hypothetical protein
MSILATNAVLRLFQDGKLSHQQRLLLLLLAHFHHDSTGECTPSIETLARQSGLSDRRVQLNIRALEKLGALVVCKRFNSGWQIANRYDLTGVTKKAGRRGVTGVSPNRDGTSIPTVDAADPVENSSQVGKSSCKGGANG